MRQARWMPSPLICLVMPLVDLRSPGMSRWYENPCIIYYVRHNPISTKHVVLQSPAEPTAGPNIIETVDFRKASRSYPLYNGIHRYRNTFYLYKYKSNRTIKFVLQLCGGGGGVGGWGGGWGESDSIYKLVALKQGYKWTKKSWRYRLTSLIC